MAVSAVILLLPKTISLIRLGVTPRIRANLFCEIAIGFLWARGYFAVTVGNVNTEDVQRYIEQQEEHHKKDDFKISARKRLRC